MRRSTAQTTPWGNSSAAPADTRMRQVALSNMYQAGRQPYCAYQLWLWEASCSPGPTLPAPPAFQKPLSCCASMWQALSRLTSSWDTHSAHVPLWPGSNTCNKQHS